MAILGAPRANTAPAQVAGATTAPAPNPAAERRKRNAQYLYSVIRKFAICPPASGAGTNQSYSAGSTLIYDVPTANGAFLESIIFICALTVTLGGTGGSFAVNAGAPLTLFDNVEVTYNGTQAKTKPFILRYLEMERGYGRDIASKVVAGTSVTTLQNAFYSTFPTVTGANTWNFYFPMRLRMIPHSAAGMLPIMGDSTKAQIKLVCASNPLGVDPILNTVAQTGVTSPTLSVSGTVQAVAVFTDGTTYLSRNPLSLDLTDEPTCQMFIDRQLNPLSANLMNRTRIDTKLRHYYMISVIVDGQQSTKFAALTNIAGLELDEDSVGQNKLMSVGSGSSNLPLYLRDYMHRNDIGQDVDEGVIVWVNGPGSNALSSDNRDALGILNMMGADGWTDANIGVQVNAVGAVAGITPRVETFLVSLNPAGFRRG